MKIIDVSINSYLNISSEILCIGFISGIVRIIAGLAQMILNALSVLFSAIPSALNCIKEDSPFHAKQLVYDFFLGGLQVLRGFVDILPFSSFKTSSLSRTDLHIMIKSAHPFAKSATVLKIGD